MTQSHIGLRLVSAIAAIVLFACSSGGGSGARAPELSPTAKARADSALWPYTKADIDFMSGMIHHHAQAIVMSRLAPTNGASSSIRILCERVINAQTDEIALMRQWLRERNQPAPEPNLSITAHQSHEHHMPGMLSEAQLKELAAARGKDFDRFFLTYMIQHHQGAITMVQELIASRGAAHDETVFKIAADINVDQETEIKRMRHMLFNLLNEKSEQ